MQWEAVALSRRLAPAGPRDSPWGGRRDGATAAWLPNPRRYSVRANPGDLPSGERLLFICRGDHLATYVAGPDSTLSRVTREPPGALAEPEAGASA